MRMANICWDCQRACGGCAWSELNPETGKPRFAPVPGWTAEQVVLQTNNNQYGRVTVDTYHITACPLFLPDEPRAVDSQILFPGQILRR